MRFRQGSVVLQIILISVFAPIYDDLARFPVKRSIRS